MRRPTLDDLKPVVALLQANELSELGHVQTTEDHLRQNWLPMPGYDIARDAWLVIAPGGQVAAMIGVGHNHASRMYAQPRVHPDYAGLELDAYLLERAIERACEIMVEAQADARVTLNVFCVAKNVEARQAFTQAGFVHVRTDWLMQIDMDQPPPAPVWPEHVMLRPYTPEMLRAIFDARNEAFQDHWGTMPANFATWQTYYSTFEDFDPSLWFTAYEGEEIAGIAICEKEGEAGCVEELAVRLPWRHKGLGLALLYQAFGEFYRRGERRVVLNVDSQNMSGATRLYTRAGMRPIQQTDQYELELRAGIELSDPAARGVENMRE